MERVHGRDREDGGSIPPRPAFMKPQRIVNRALLEARKRERCCVCEKYGCDPDHIKTVGAGGDDVENNVWPLCRTHHVERHQLGVLTFIRKHPGAQAWLRLYRRFDMIDKALKPLGFLKN